MANSVVTTERARRVAKLQRDLAELRARMGRIESETFGAKREIGEIEAEVKALLEGGAP